MLACGIATPLASFSQPPHWTADVPLFLRELALGSRLKALSDQFYQAVDEVYKACGAGIESRWFPVLRYLRDVGPTTVTDMALAIGQTHSAVSQLADRRTSRMAAEKSPSPCLARQCR